MAARKHLTSGSEETVGIAEKVPPKPSDLIGLGGFGLL